MWAKNRRIILLFIGYSIAFVVLANMMPKQLNWNPSFSNKHDWPFGNYILFEELESIFPGNEIEVATKPLYNLTKDTSYQNTNYLLVDRFYYPDSLERLALMKFVSEGNNAFISASAIIDRLRDTLNISLESDFNLDLNNVTALNALKIPIGFYNENIIDTSYNAKVSRVQHFFKILNDTISRPMPTKISWSQDEEHPVFIRVPFGEGFFYLHSMPFVFTNYHMVHENTNEYIAQCLSYLPNQNVLWDEYHKQINAMYKKSIMHVVLSHHTLKWAYWIGLFTLFTFMLFHAKRKQRIIPVIDPVKNDSLDFTETIGALYYNQGNHTDIAHKKIKMFKEYLSRTYYMHDIEFDEKDKNILLQKTIHKEVDLDHLFKVIKNTLQSSSVTEERLKLLNKKINEFYKK